MPRWNWKKAVVASFVGVGTAIAPLYSVHAEPRPSRPPGSAAPLEQKSLRGTVEELLKNGPGDVDGLRLDDGTVVHFPPHVGAEVAQSIEPGSPISVEGAFESRPGGEIVFEATRIDSRGTAITVSPPRPPRRAPEKGPRETPLIRTGVVEELVTNRAGDVDGLILDDGTEVKFPPHLGAELERLLNRGDKARIEGRKHVTPHGETHLHADRIVALSTGKEIARDEPRGMPEGRRPGHPAPAAKERPAPGGEERPSPATNAEILKELRALRELLERTRP